jgi:serine/threonine protein kinase
MLHDLATFRANGSYLLGEVLGSGGMGTVYSAIQTSLGRRVAIKFPHAELANDPFVIRRFRAEATAGGKLDHRNIARVIDLGGNDGALFLVMEYVTGVALDKLLIDHGPLEVHVAAELCSQILAGLHAAHSSGVIHADIKCANVLVEWPGDGTPIARLIDFGLARFSDDPVKTDDHLVSGTPDFLAPELILGGVPTVASDIYAAGVVLYELLTGTTPFGSGSSDEILRRQLEDAVVPPSLRCPEQDISPAIEAVVLRALAKNPSARFATAASFAATLRIACPPRIIGKARLARGTQVNAAFSTAAVTRDWRNDEVPIVAGAHAQVDRARAAVVEALAGSDSDQVIASYLDLASSLIAGSDLASAVAELERGLMQLRGREEPAAMWRLQLCLAGLYSGLGHGVLARTAARVGRDDATRAGSTLGQDRANELLVRLARHCKSPSPR